MPDWLEPMAATLTQERFTGPEWMFERKFDGIRLLAFKHGDDVRLLSRNRLPQHLPGGRRGGRAAAGRTTSILDGEVDLGSARSSYHVFDILWLDGRDVTALPLEERRALLRALPLAAAAAARRAARRRRSRGSARAREGWEGVIAKRRDSPYEHRRSKHWLKMKCEASQELVVGGFTDPQGARVGLGALLVGYYEGDDFVFAGKVGTGFDTKLLLDLRARLDAHRDRRRRRSRGHRPAAAARALGAPEIVVQVAFIEWTVHGKLRHPRLLGVRIDKRRARGRAGDSRDHASREGAVPRRRHHQGRARRVLRERSRRSCCRTSAAGR